MNRKQLFIVQPAVTLPSGCVHTPQPTGYLQWHYWADRAAKTHDQIRCEQCGRWAAWLPKAEARAINKRRLAELNASLISQGLERVKASEY